LLSNEIESLIITSRQYIYTSEVGNIHHDMATFERGINNVIRNKRTIKSSRLEVI